MIIVACHITRLRASERESERVKEKLRLVSRRIHPSIYKTSCKRDAERIKSSGSISTASK